MRIYLVSPNLSEHFTLWGKTSNFASFVFIDTARATKNIALELVNRSKIICLNKFMYTALNPALALEYRPWVATTQVIKLPADAGRYGMLHFALTKVLPIMAARLEGAVNKDR